MINRLVCTELRLLIVMEITIFHKRKSSKLNKCMFLLIYICDKFMSPVLLIQIICSQSSRGPNNYKKSDPYQSICPARTQEAKCNSHSSEEH